jgi:broad specificity phosphatase PhoE
LLLNLAAGSSTKDFATQEFFLSVTSHVNMKRKITWIRHAQSTWNAEGIWQGHTNVPLSELGESQARALRQRLKDRPFDLIYSSDLERCQRTCRLALPGAKMIVDKRLREINFGIYEGKSKNTLTAAQAEAVQCWWVDPYQEKLEGGESMACLNQRVGDFLSGLPQQCDIAIFTHGGVIRNAIWQIVGIPVQGAWSVQIENTSVTTLEYTSRRTLVHGINDCAHLVSCLETD